MEYKVSNLGSELFTLEEVKSYLKITYTDDDNLLNDLITSSRQLAENYVGVSLITKTITVFFDEDEVESDYLLPFPPHDAIIEVKRADTVLSADQYQKYGLTQFRVRFNAIWSTSEISTPNTAEFTYTTLAETNNLKEFKSALYKNIGELYEMRKNGYEGSYTSLTENTISKLNRLKLV